MAVNKHFHTSGVAAISTEQNLYADLVAEAIQIHGHDVYYLDRTLVAEDTVLGEDSLSKFNTQSLIEMYMEDSGGGFAGEKELMSQFGLQNLSEATFVVSKTRFQEKTKQIQIEAGTDSTSSGSILLESGTIDSTSKLEGSNFYIVNETDATDADRPQEGDAIYHPTLKKLFEINFVDHDEPFYQLDSNPVYKMRCRLFDYGSEALDTGITEIDAIESSLSVASSDYQLTLEQSTGTTINQGIRIVYDTSEDSGLLLDETDSDNIIGEDETTLGGESILLETGGDEFLIQEDYIIGDMSTDKTAQNELFETLDDTVLDFSESNPFGDAGSAD
jgi:hypothetical protein|tara:strand:- start:545 stop:1540 length:996 start_codon:yes stop_codon:yes gene_type:complete